LKQLHIYLFLLFACLSTLASCNRLDTFEKNEEIKGHAWHYQQQPEINFNITDTAAAYNIFITLRHTDAYAYKNIWLLVSTRQPGDSAFQSDRIELTLQQNDGQWLGTGFNDIWELRYPLFANIRFRKSGPYTIRLRQNMRDNPLLHIMNAGIRIEKVNL
jgi:gliding motility-associated lipoprotein GldH